MNPNDLIKIIPVRPDEKGNPIKGVEVLFTLAQLKAFIQAA